MATDFEIYYIRATWLCSFKESFGFDKHREVFSKNFLSYDMRCKTFSDAFKTIFSHKMFLKH